MSTASIRTASSASWGLSRSATSEGASPLFMAFAIGLLSIAFVTPISEAWKCSTYDNYDSEIDEGSVSGGTMSRQIVLGSLGLFGLIALAWPGGKPIRVPGIVGILCFAYLAWCILTLLWTDDFSMTSRREVAYLCEVVGGLGIARHATARQFVWIVLACCLIWLGLGFLAELSLGTFRPWAEGNRFAGVFHPNIMGVNAAMVVLASLYLAAGTERRKWLLYSVAAIGFVFLVLTRSRTSLGAMFIALAVMMVIMAPPSRRLAYVVLAGVGVACLALILGTGAFVTSSELFSLGREDYDMSTITGRVPLWQELIEGYAYERPWSGYGYGAFWTPTHIDEVSRTVVWPVTHAHSSYIDLVLNIGFVGAGLCLSAMALAFFAAWHREVMHPRAGYGFVALIVVYGLVSGLTETYIGITWFLSFFGVCGVCYLLFRDEQETPHDAADQQSPRFAREMLYRRDKSATNRDLYQARGDSPSVEARST